MSKCIQCGKPTLKETDLLCHDCKVTKFEEETQEGEGGDYWDGELYHEEDEDDWDLNDWY